MKIKDWLLTKTKTRFIFNLLIIFTLMTLLELKRSLHDKIDNLDDLEMLNEIISVKDEVIIIPEFMKEGIQQGEKDIKNGDFYTMEDFEKKYEKWLKE